MEANYGNERAVTEKETLTDSIGQKEEHEEWCFGMIVGLETTHPLPDHGPETLQPLHIPRQSTSIFNAKTNKPVGDLSRNARAVLNVLQDELLVQTFAAQSPRRTPQCILKSSPKQEVKTRRGTLGLRPEVHIVLYGPPPAFDSVGLFTARCNLYLQHPINCDKNVLYRNPQCLTVRGDEKIYTYDLAHASSASNQYIGGLPNPIDLFTGGEDQAGIKEADSPQDLKTQLYRHQKQALTFMLQREKGWALDGSQRDIWKADQEAGRVTYVNIISGGQRYRAPPPFRGGLLIDAPGLGKSLSIIALITATFSKNNHHPTLLIVPKTLIQTWNDELQKHLRSSSKLKCCTYYGKDRRKLLEQLNSFALIITTYSIVRIDWKASRNEPEGLATLHSISWARIVLDEAHVIREPSKSFAKSVCALQADRRWAVTGTPIQNRLLDLFSLFKFLQAFPFDDLRTFNSQVTEKWKTRSDQESVAKLKTLVNCLSLRRPKDTITLPARQDKTTYVEFSDVERYQYQKVKEGTLHRIDTAEKGQVGPTFLNALKWVNQLRLLCNHGTAGGQVGKTPQQEHSSQLSWCDSEAQKYFDELDQAGLAKCSNPTCGQELSSVLTDDDHCDEPSISETLDMFCSCCARLEDEASSRLRQICNHLPRRFTETTSAIASGQSATKAASSVALGQSLLATDSAPSKIRRVVQDLEMSPDDVKSVVFSFWTKTFDILQPHLWAKSIRCVRLDGSLSATGRANVLRVFRTNPEIKVLLATISCGGIGLDLTTASRAYIMEPQWNPMSESQALDRIHRLGQEKEVVTTRYVMRNSFEEQVLALQRRKQELADLTLDHGGINKAELTYGRLQYLRQLVG